MNSVYIDAVFLLISITTGIIAGWCVKGWSFRNTFIALEQERTEEVEEEKTKSVEVMGQLQLLAADVAAHVGEHNSRIKDINNELASPESQSRDTVLAAISKLVEANNQMHAKLQSAEKKLEEKSREIESRFSEARTDALTQINNRRAFDEEMKKCLDEYTHQGRVSCVMMLDVDFFKKFNDTHGHKAGDEVLKHVAKTLKQTIAKTEIVCRYGGEEFAVIFPGSNLISAKAGAERARAAIGNSKIDFEGKSLRVAASAGLAEFLPKEDIEGVLKRADDALYQSKKAGRNCGHFSSGTEFIPFVPRLKVEDAVPTPTPPVAAPAIVVPPVAVPSAPTVATSTPSTQVAPLECEPPKIAAGRDSLTGLSNSAAFYDDITRRLNEWKRGGAPMSIAFMQIDRLSDIMAEHGPGAETLIVKAGAQFLKATCRDMDHIARYDDDTFSMLLPTARIKNATALAERLRKAVAKCKLPFNQSMINFTVSFGVAEAIQGDTTSRLVQRASSAVNTALNQGGNRTFIHNGDRAYPVVPLEAPVEA